MFNNVFVHVDVCNCTFVFTWARCAPKIKMTVFVSHPFNNVHVEVFVFLSFGGFPRLDFNYCSFQRNKFFGHLRGLRVHNHKTFFCWFCVGMARPVGSRQDANSPIPQSSQTAAHASGRIARRAARSRPRTDGMPAASPARAGERTVIRTPLRYWRR